MRQGGFISDTGCHVTLGNLKRKVRHLTAGKAPICVMPSLPVPASYRQRVDVVRFRAVVLHWALCKIMEPVHEFNERGGMLLEVGGAHVHFGNMFCLNISADSPQAKLIAACGSGCWACMCPEDQMGDYNATFGPRTADGVEKLRSDCLDAVHGRNRAVFPSVEAARAAAQTNGINLRLRNGLERLPGQQSLFGPDLGLDDVYRALCAGRLHLLDEGTAVKVLKVGMHMSVEGYRRLNPCVAGATDRARKMWEGLTRNKALGQVDAHAVAIANARPRSSNVELEDAGSFQVFPPRHHGVPLQG